MMLVGNVLVLQLRWRGRREVDGKNVHLWGLGIK